MVASTGKPFENVKNSVIVDLHENNVHGFTLLLKAISLFPSSSIVNVFDFGDVLRLNLVSYTKQLAT